MILRHLFGFQGDSLINGVIAPNSVRNMASAREDYIQSVFLFPLERNLLSSTTEIEFNELNSNFFQSISSGNIVANDGLEINSTPLINLAETNSIFPNNIENFD